MSYLTFPTKPGPLPNGGHPNSGVGLPLRALACGCGRPLVEDDGCVLCGHWLCEVVDRTWRDRARVVSGVLVAA